MATRCTISSAWMRRWRGTCRMRCRVKAISTRCRRSSRSSISRSPMRCWTGSWRPDDAPPTAVQKRLFGETARAGADLRAKRAKVARSLARNAYRRPPSDAELDVLLGVFDLAQKNKLAYPAALRLMLKAVLVSPQFLFITPGEGAEPGQRSSRSTTINSPRACPICCGPRCPMPSCPRWPTAASSTSRRS